LSNLVDLCLVPLTLQIDEFSDSFAPEDMVAATDTFYESKVEQERLQIGEPSVGVRSSTKNDPQERLVLSHLSDFTCSWFA